MNISHHILNVQDILEKLRRVIKESAPMVEETISYRRPAFKLNGYLVFFAAFKNHIGFYPTPSGIVAFKKELSPYKQAKGSVQFPIDTDSFRDNRKTNKF